MKMIDDIQVYATDGFDGQTAVSGSWLYAARTMVVACIASVLLTCGCSRSDSEQEGGAGADLEKIPADSESGLTTSEVAFLKEKGPMIQGFCGDCHAMPRPTSSPMGEWDMEIIQGFDLYKTSGRSDLSVPDKEDVHRYFSLQAPASLGMPLPETLNYPPAPDTHDKSGLHRNRTRAPGVTNVNWVDLGLESNPGNALVYCDIGTGAVNAYWPDRPNTEVKRLGTLLQPVHTEVCDLDQDGLQDLLVADIGEFNADDSELGRVVWLRRQNDSEKFRSHILLEGASRVSDARAGDMDGDGDLDVLVAAFGWRNSGKTILLVNEGLGDDGLPRFVARDIDSRHGPVHVPLIDWDDDGDLDFVSLISQEHERVELFRNDGQGHFESELIWAAPDPAYGSSGIDLVDMDGDGDMDVLYTNGDSFDRGPKPYHSVQWLENEGTLPMKRHEICRMPGVLNAVAEDFDGDGDKDVVAVCLLVPEESRPWVAQGASPIVMLTQEADGSFTPSSLGGRMHDHLSVASGDFNGDSKPDFAVGNFFRPAASELPVILKEPELLIWNSK